MVDKQKLKGKIVGAGFTQYDLAKQMGISVNAFSNKMNGKTSFSINEVQTLCNLLNNLTAEEKLDIFLPNSPNNGTVQEGDSNA